jgi:hypothetical protein
MSIFHFGREEDWFPPRELTPQQEKRQQAFFMKMLLHEANLIEKKAKKKAKQELRAAEKALTDAPK